MKAAPQVPLVWGREDDPNRQTLTIGRIVAACADHCMIRATELKSRRRSIAIVRARQAAMYVAAEHTSKSLPQIGQHTGGFDHTTVLHARNRVRADLADGGERYGDIVETVERALGLR